MKINKEFFASSHGCSEKDCGIALLSAHQDWNAQVDGKSISDASMNYSLHSRCWHAKKKTPFCSKTTLSSVLQVETASSDAVALH
jgi:hypothetical protein